MNMKQLALVGLIGLLGCHGSWAQNKEAMSPELEKRLKEFFADKEAHARTLAKEEKQEQAPDVWKFFEAGKGGDWADVASLYRSLRSGAYQYDGGRKDKRLETTVWQPV